LTRQKPNKAVELGCKKLGLLKPKTAQKYNFLFLGYFLGLGLLHFLHFW